MTTGKDNPLTPPASRSVPTTAADAARVTPRAEFRVFGHGIIDDVKRHLWNGRTVLQQQRQMPKETYVLSRHTNEANVKVRDGLLDIKVKVGETAEGYEIFQPRGKFQFPVQHEELAAILSHLRIDVVVPPGGCTFETFAALAHAHPDLTLVEVEKVRSGFSIDGVICEYAQVYFNGALVESACVESDNYAAMKSVVVGLGLSSRPNVNYLKAAKKVVGLG